MKIRKINKRADDKDTFYLAFSLTKSDVRRLLTEDLDYMTDEALPRDFWTDVFGVFLTNFGPQRRRLSVADPVGAWAFDLALRYKYLVPDAMEENQYLINDKLLAISKPGPKPVMDE